MRYKLNTETEMLNCYCSEHLIIRSIPLPPYYHDLFLIPDEFTL